MRTRPAALLMLVFALAAILAPPAQAAKRTVPFGFFGTVFNNNQFEHISDATLDAQMAAMASSGVESVRVSLRWADEEPSPGRYDFTQADRVVKAAARHHIEVLPIVLHTPRWASPSPSTRTYYLWAPRKASAYANFLTALVRRYGPHGSLWATSGTPRVPVRTWQIWNEEAADFFFRSRGPWPTAYVKLLKAAHRAIHRADKGATVVLGSLAGVTHDPTPWGQLHRLYKAGAKGSFDAVSVHFFSAASNAKATARFTADLAEKVRAEMRRARYSRPIWFTELTWTAAQGKIPRSALLGFETTAKGQAARLNTVFSELARDRKRRGIGRLYWYNWASEYVPTYSPTGPGSLTFQYSGLNKITGETFTPLPLLSTYARTAAHFEGCRKSTNARRCG
jgi:polysaccharide biosynthesis protein PslG